MSVILPPKVAAQIEAVRAKVIELARAPGGTTRTILKALSPIKAGFSPVLQHDLTPGEQLRITRLPDGGMSYEIVKLGEVGKLTVVH